MDAGETPEAALQRELEEARAEQDLPGLAMAIAFRDRRELWVGTTGMADLAAGEAWRADHRSRIGSVTKTFTSAVIFQLAEEGLLALDRPDLRPFAAERMPREPRTRIRELLARISDS